MRHYRSPVTFQALGGRLEFSNEHKEIGSSEGLPFCAVRGEEMADFLPADFGSVQEDESKLWGSLQAPPVPRQQGWEM